MGCWPRRLPDGTRRAVGRTLLAIGASTTSPLALQVLRKERELTESRAALP